MTISVGRELRVALVLRDKTAREVAQRAGLSVWQLSRILNDRSRPDREALRRVRAAIFDDELVAA